jgi:hypothetical protein
LTTIGSPLAEAVVDGEGHVSVMAGGGAGEGLVEVPEHPAAALAQNAKAARR